MTFALAGVPPRAIAARGWLSDVTATLEVLSERAALRYAVLLAVSALAMPYGGLIHDAQLYAFQVLNRLRPGVFSSDLFLKYGSQDQYSPFSVVAAPIARLIGLDAAFFVLFLVSSVLLVIGVERLVFALIADPVHRMVAALFMLVSPMPYAGLRVLFVRESFLTPRTASIGLALLALAAVLRGRHAVAMLLALSATLVHPIMGVGALVVVIAVAAFSTVPARAVYGAAAAGGAMAVVLGYRPAGAAVFGTMSAEWIETLSAVSPYAVIEGWSANDWRQFAVALLVVGGAALVTVRDARRCSTLLFAGAAVAAGAIVVSAVATACGYRLLIQAQPSRAVWLVQALQIPAAIVLARYLWVRHAWGPVGAVAVLGGTSLMDFTAQEFALALIVGLAAVLALKPLNVVRTPAALALATAVGIVGGAAIWGSLKATVLLQRLQDFRQLTELTFYVRALLDCIPRPVWLGVVLLALTWLLAMVPGRRYRTAVAVGLVLAVGPHAALFALQQWPAFQSMADSIRDDAAFTRAFLDRRYPDPMTRPTVYAGAWSDIGRVWLGLDARSYLAVIVVIFREETARETRRRAEVVRAFEFARWRGGPDLVPEVARPLVDYLYARDGTPAEPRLADLERVCRPEEDVDVVVVSQDFGNRASANNGRVFLYECERVRALAS